MLYKTSKYQFYIDNSTSGVCNLHHSEYFYVFDYRVPILLSSDFNLNLCSFTN